MESYYPCSVYPSYSIYAVQQGTMPQQHKTCKTRHITAYLLQALQVTKKFCLISTQVLTPSLLLPLETDLAVAIKQFCGSGILHLNKGIILFGILFLINFLDTP